MNKDFLIEESEKRGIFLTENQLNQFSIYEEFLLEYNQKVNLTAITKPKEVVIKHFLDGLLLTNYLSFTSGEKVLDFGTGAGFPGMVLKIFQPEIQLTLVDSLQKRIVFLEELSRKLGFDDVICFHGRGEEIGKMADFREQFDVVTARAVANLSVLSELCLPLVKVGGLFVSMKGNKVEEEVELGKHAISVLGGNIQQVESYTLEQEQDRAIVLIKKISQTSTKYPRNPGKIQKAPL